LIVITTAGGEADTHRKHSNRSRKKSVPFHRSYSKKRFLVPSSDIEPVDSIGDRFHYNMRRSLTGGAKIAGSRRRFFY
jgi:hypothetical protein